MDSSLKSGSAVKWTAGPDFEVVTTACVLDDDYL